MMIIRGKVIHGQSLGRTLGFPTANITLPQDTEVENGVYISTVLVQNVKYRAVSNVGVKPTAGIFQRALECHLLDFSGDLYGLSVEVTLEKKLRDEMHFESIEALREQIKLDIEKVKIKN